MKNIIAIMALSLMPFGLNANMSPTAQNDNISEAVTNDIAQEVVGTILSNPELLREYQNGNLNLEEFVADQFGEKIKKAADKIGDKTKAGAKKAKKDIKDAAKKVKDISGDVAKVANKTLTKITDSDTIMNVVKTSTGIFQKMIPLAANAAGILALSVPGVGPALVPVIATAGGVLTKVVTPDNVEKALNVAAEVASFADVMLNKEEKSSLAPSSTVPMLATNYNLVDSTMDFNKKDIESADEDIVSKGVKMLFERCEALSEYVSNVAKDQLKSDKMKKILNAIDLCNKVSKKITQ